MGALQRAHRNISIKDILVLEMQVLHEMKSFSKYCALNGTFRKGTTKSILSGPKEGDIKLNVLSSSQKAHSRESDFQMQCLIIWGKPGRAGVGSTRGGGRV